MLFFLPFWMELSLVGEIQIHCAPGVPSQRAKTGNPEGQRQWRHMERSLSDPGTSSSGAEKGLPLRKQLSLDLTAGANPRNLDIDVHAGQYPPSGASMSTGLTGINSEEGPRQPSGSDTRDKKAAAKEGGKNVSCRHTSAVNLSRTGGTVIGSFQSVCSVAVSWKRKQQDWIFWLHKQASYRPPIEVVFLTSCLILAHTLVVCLAGTLPALRGAIPCLWAPCSIFIVLRGLTVWRNSIMSRESVTICLFTCRQRCYSIGWTWFPYWILGL